MSFRRLGFIIAAVVEATGAATLTAAVVSGIYGEWADARVIALSGLVVVVVADLARRSLTPHGEMTTREGFAAVALSWFAMAFVGTLPYLVTGSLDGLTDAFFETAAGITTTGSSVVPDPAALSHGVLWWRALTQWMGGMGIIVLSIAILPLLGTGGVQLARAESPGPTPDRLTPRFRETAKRLWLVYFGLTVAEAALLSMSNMTVFDAITHAFTTMSTGGFGTKAASLAAFDNFAQWVVIVFMMLAGVSFALHYKALRYRDPLAYLRHAEFRIYAGILAAATAFIVIGTWGGNAADTVREGVFTSVSLVTTTGYATADFGQWASSLQVLVVGLMFVGGMAGSTAGSVKVYRLGHAVHVHVHVGDACVCLLRLDRRHELQPDDLGFGGGLCAGQHRAGVGRGGAGGQLCGRPCGRQVAAVGDHDRWPARGLPGGPAVYPRVVAALTGRAAEREPPIAVRGEHCACHAF
jgi:trk system potassium uptake protein TrkH